MCLFEGGGVVEIWIRCRFSVASASLGLSGEVEGELFPFGIGQIKATYIERAM